MDLTWFVIPAAVGLFVLRTVLIARRLRTAASSPTLADVRALGEARSNLHGHRASLEASIEDRKGHLAEAKRLARLPGRSAPFTNSRIDRMVEDFLPERRL